MAIDYFLRQHFFEGETTVGSVAISEDGTTILIGAPGEGYGPTVTASPGSLDICDIVSINGSVGACYVFVYDADVNGWVQEAHFIPEDFEAGSKPAFGFTVALSADGDTAIIGGFDSDRRMPTEPDEEGNCEQNSIGGAAYIWVRVDGEWSQQAKLTGLGEGRVQWLGMNVGLAGDGNTAVVVEPARDGDEAGWEGYVTVFERDLSDDWDTREELAPDDTHATNVPTGGYLKSGPSYTLCAISRDGLTVAFGGVQTTEAGHVWTFTRPDRESGWDELFSGFNPGQLDGYAGSTIDGPIAHGLALSADGLRMFLGATLNEEEMGWVLGRKLTGPSLNWEVEAVIQPVNREGAPEFSTTAGAFTDDGNTLVVGHYGDGYTEGQFPGAAWVYRRTVVDDVPVWTEDLDDFWVGDPIGTGSGDALGRDVAITADGGFLLLASLHNGALLYQLEGSGPPPGVGNIDLSHVRYRIGG